MPDTRNTTWTTNRVKLLLLSALLAVSAGRAQIGILSLTSDPILSKVPGGPPFARSRAAVALVVDSRLVDRAQWRRLITSDGLAGWASNLTGELHSVRVDGSADFSFVAKSPDNPSFTDATELDVPHAVGGTILGASLKSRVSHSDELKLPPHLRLEDLPWLHLRFAAIEGYAPLAALKIHWAAEADTHLLDDSSLARVSTAPFLASAAPSLVDLAPRKGEPVQSADSPESLPMPEADPEPQILLRAGPTSHPASLAIFSAAAARVLVLASNARKISFLFPAHQPIVRRAEFHDLDGDGTPEWLFEIDSIYGDGFYSRLCVVNGSGPAHLSCKDLAHESGEGDAETVAAGWWVDHRQGIVWIGRADSSATTLTGYRFSAGRWVVVPAPWSNLPLAVVVQTRNFDEASGAALSPSHPSEDLGVFPLRKGGTVLWLAGYPFTLALDAKAWILRHPGARLPN